MSWEQLDIFAWLLSSSKKQPEAQELLTPLWHKGSYGAAQWNLSPHGMVELAAAPEPPWTLTFNFKNAPDQAALFPMYSSTCVCAQ